MGWAQWSHVQFVIVNMAQGPVNLNKQRHEAQNALTRLMPVMNETPDLPSVHYTEYYCTCAQEECQALFTCDQRTLTKIFLHDKIRRRKSGKKATTATHRILWEVSAMKGSKMSVFRKVIFVIWVL